MQSYTEIPSSQSLQSSLLLLLNNDKTAISCNSGSAFPTTNLQAGMLCYRTDQRKLYILRDTVPTWMVIADLSAATAAVSEAVHSFLIRNSGSVGEGGKIVMQKPTGGSGLADNVAIEVSGNNVRFYDIGTGNGFYLDMTAGAASAGAKIWTDANDGAGSGMDADMLDGYHAGNASGQIPVSNGAANANLNADMVDGYHAGNASGQIALNNGTVNTNLNADMLDGYHGANYVRTVDGMGPSNGNVQLNVANRVSRFGDTMTGALTVTSHIMAHNNNGAGTLYLGNSGARYLHYDGGSYHMPGGWLYTDNVVADGQEVVSLTSNTDPVTGTGEFSKIEYSIYKSGRTVVFERKKVLYNCNCNCNCRCANTCFPANTPVLTEEGWKAISKVRVGDTVVAEAGVMTKVLGLWTPALGDRKIYNVADKVHVTGDHLFKGYGRWLAVEPDGYAQRVGKLVQTKDGMNIDLGTIPAEDVGDMIVGSMLQTIDGPHMVMSIEEVEKGYTSKTKLYALVTEAGTFVVNGGFIVDGIPQKKGE